MECTLEKNKAYWTAVAGLFTAMVLWGSSFVALKIAFRSYPPMVVIFGRMFIGSICFLLLFKKITRGVQYRKGDWKMLVGLAVFEPCLYFVFEAMALVNTSASQAGMIVSMLPLLVAIAARIFLKESISARTLGGFLIAVAGACWLSIGGQATENAPNPILGNFLEFIAMVCATGYTIMIKKLSVRYPALFITAVQAFIGAIFFFPLIFITTPNPWPGFEAEGFIAILYLGAIVTCGAYGLYNYGVIKIPASQASAFTNLIPVFTILLGWLLLGEQLTFMQYVACGLVFSGVLLSQDPGFSWRGWPVLGGKWHKVKFFPFK